MALAKKYYTPQEYLQLEREAEYKSEYIDGQVYAMAGVSEEHNLIALNIASEIRAQFRGKPCRVYMSDIRVKVSATGTYTYPDVHAVCGQAVFEDREVDTLTNPTIIVEVLSPSTEVYDRGMKFARYRSLESLREYVLISQDSVRVERFTRQGDMGDEWVLREVTSLDGELHLASIGCDIALADIYEKVEFPIDKST